MKSTKLSVPYLLGLFCCYAVASGFSIWDIICLHCGRWTYISTSTLAVQHTSTVYTCACSVAQSCPTLCIPMDDYSPPGSCVHGVIQARILEWVAISSCRGSSPPRHQTHILWLLHWQVDSLPLSHLGNPYYVHPTLGFQYCHLFSYCYLD